MSLSKHLALGSLVLAAAIAFGQSTQPGVADKPHVAPIPPSSKTIQYRNPSAACPVSILDVTFTRPVRYMPAAGVSEADPRLEMKILNKSDKDIESLDFSGRIRVKASPYQLDATVIDVPLKLSFAHSMRQRDTSLEALALAQNAFGFDRITLDRVHYTDGTTWTRDRDICTYRSQTDLRQLK